MNNKKHLISTSIKKCLSFFLCSFLIIQIISLGVISGNAVYYNTPGTEISNLVASDYQTVTFTTNYPTGTHGYVVNNLYFGKDASYNSSKMTAIQSSTNIHTYRITDSGTYYYYKELYQATWSEGYNPVITHLGGSAYFKSDPITFYKTTLNVNGGKCDISQVIVEAGKNCVFPQATREGYVFKGWSEASWATSGVASYTPNGDSTFYACWEKEPDPEPVHTHVPTTLPAVPATCTETGLTKGSYCATCGEILQKQTETPALGHFYEPYRVVAPTCQKQGYTIYQCLRCLDFKNDNYTDIVPHKYDNGVCIYCNAVDPDSKGILGDVDSSGEVDTVDSTYIQRYATRVKVPFTDEQMLIGDVDGDGDITVTDATFIQRYTTRVKTPYKIGDPI